MKKIYVSGSDKCYEENEERERVGAVGMESRSVIRERESRFRETWRLFRRGRALSRVRTVRHLSQT